MRYLNLWLVRHGETKVNRGEWSVKPNETGLTLQGMEQAERSAAQVLEPPDLFIVSPLIRAQETSRYFIDKWPETPVISLAIQEFVYLSPMRLSQLGKVEIRAEINEYWQRADPYFCDGTDSESFASFLQRISRFHDEIMKMQGYVVAIGHGQFFKAFQLSLSYGTVPDSHWMQNFRTQETLSPIKNGEIVKLFFDR